MPEPDLEAICQTTAGSTKMTALLALMIAAAPAGVSAAGTVADEKSRVAVQYSATSNCQGAQSYCNVTFVPLPGGKKRFETHRLSCRVRLNSGSVYTSSIEGLPEPRTLYEFLEPKFTGSHSGKNYYDLDGLGRYQVRKSDELRVYVSASGDVDQVICSLLGDLITYN
jgi:hypothetical protein